MCTRCYLLGKGYDSIGSSLQWCKKFEIYSVYAKDIRPQIQFVMFFYNILECTMFHCPVLSLSLTIFVDTSHLNVCFEFKKSHKSQYIKEDKVEGLPGKRKALRSLLFSSSTCVTFLLQVLWFKKIWFCPRCSWSTRDRMSSVALKTVVQTVYLYLHLQYIFMLMFNIYMYMYQFYKKVIQMQYQQYL